MMDLKIMYMLIRHFDGRLQEAMMLSVQGRAMRIALKDTDDIVELTLCGGQWLLDGRDPVEMEFLAATAEEEWRLFCDGLAAMEEIARPTPGAMPN